MQQTIVWFHIPKTAGTSIVAEICRFAVPWAHVVNGEFSQERGAVIGNARNHLRALKEEALRGTFRIMFGHMTQRDFLAAIGRHPNFRYATLLREPEERLFSEYSYLTSAPAQPNRAYFAKRYPTFDSYVDELVDGNLQAHYLEEYRGEPVSRIVDRLIEEYALAESIETYDEGLRQLKGFFGADDEPPPYRLNVSPNTTFALSAARSEKIRERNERDVELYNAFMTRRLNLRARHA